MRFNKLWNNFIGGEWSKRMQGRTEVPQYQNACEELTNMFPLQQGGAYMRPGTLLHTVPEFDSGVTDCSPTNILDRLSANVRCRTFAFTNSLGVQYVLFLSAGYSFTTENGNYYGTGIAPYEANWFCLRNPRPGHGWNDSTVFTNVMYCSTKYDLYFELSTMKFTQVGDLVIISDTNDTAGGIVRPPYVAFPTAGGYQIKSWYNYVNDNNKNAKGVWNCVPYNIPKVGPTATNGGGPFYTNNYRITVTGTLTTGGTVTLTAGSSLFFSSYVNTEFPTFFRFTGGGKTTVVRITGYTSGTVLTGIVVAQPVVAHASGDTFGGTTQDTSWDYSIWNNKQGWPKSFCTFQQRLYAANTTSFPDTLWGSQIENVFHFTEIPLAQDSTFATFSDDGSRAWAAYVNSAQVSRILHMDSSKMLAILTDNHEITAYGSNGALGPDDRNFDISSAFGADDVKPVRIASNLTFVQKGGKLRDIEYSFDEFQYKSNDLQFTSDHLKSCTKIDSLENRSTMLIGMRGPVGGDDGIGGVDYPRAEGIDIGYDGESFVSCTLDKQYNVTAWAKHFFANTGSDEVVTVIDFCVLSKSRVMFIVDRYRDGEHRVTIEEIDKMYFGKEDDDNDNIYFPNWNYMDCALVYSRVMNSESAGADWNLDAAAGDTFVDRDVHVFGLPYTNPEKGWVYLGEFTVDGGGVLSDPILLNYQSIAVGFAYEASIVPTMVEAGSQWGTSQPSQKRAYGLSVLLHNTLGLKYSYHTPGEETEENLFDVPLRPDSNPFDNSIDLYSTVAYLKFEGGYRRDYRVRLTSSGPFPINILSMALEGQTNE